ncbi:MAG TPA: ComF family protein [Albitalea sp.]
MPLTPRLLSRPTWPALPTQCAICRDWGPQRLCAACCQRFIAAGPRCERCALAVPAGVTVCGACLTRPAPWRSALAAVDYTHPWDQLIAHFKFHAALDLAAALARCLGQAWRLSGRAAPSLLLPVPLSAQRLRERGYNQAWELARRVASRIGCPADSRLLLRIRDTPHQLALPIDRRGANVRGAFAVDPLRLDALRGRSVTVLDDVMTTGATATEITRVLQQAGAAEVHWWVLARTPAPGE